MEPLLAKLTEIVTCDICQSIFTAPRTLECLHTFCSDCLQRHIGMLGLGGECFCPTCRRPFYCTTPSDVEKFPSNFFVNSVLGVIEESTPKDDGSGISCSNCSKVRTETGVCFDCGSFMCSDCLIAHVKKRHKVKLTKYLDSDDCEILRLKSQSSSPQLHDNLCKVIFFYSSPAQCL